ncbi:MAG: hypothetical protein ACPHQR_04310 [Candidatus Poseidoniaceae archaeon]
MTTGDGNDVFWDSGWQSGAAAPAPQQPTILPANPVSSNQPSIAIGANAATGGSMSAKPKRSFGGPKHPVALGILVVVANVVVAIWKGGGENTMLSWLYLVGGVPTLKVPEKDMSVPEFQAWGIKTHSVQEAHL